MRLARQFLFLIALVCVGFIPGQRAYAGEQAAAPRTSLTATPRATSNNALPTFTGFFSWSGYTFPYTMAGGAPQAGGTTTIPTVILPVSFVFDGYLDANGDKIELDATSVVPNVIQSPIFQNYPFSTGNTQYGDAVQRAEFWNVMGNNWHTLLGQPTVLPAVQIEITPGHAYVMQSQGTGGNFAVVDVVFAENALFQALGSLLKTAITPGQLGIVLFRNTAFYGTTLPADALWAEDPTVCCSFGEHGVVGTTAQPYVIASYIDSGLLPQTADGLAPQSNAALPIASDVQAVSEQIVEWLNDPFFGTSSANSFPYWQPPQGIFESCGGQGAVDPIFSAEPTHFLLPSQSADEVSINGFTYHLQNAALLPWYEQIGSSAAFNGAYSYPDTSVLTGPAQSCNEPIPTPTVQPLPQGASNGHALIGYWESYLEPDIFFPLSEVSPQFDVIIVSFASPVQGSTSLLQFNPPSEQTAAQFMADIKSLQSQGKKVLISLGGGGTVVTLNTAADIKNFVTSVAAVVQQYGFDGIDLDIENPSIILNPGDTDFRNPTTPSITNLIAACRQLHNQFGTSFMLAMVPEVAQLQAGFESYSGTSGSFLPVVYGLRDILSFVDHQDYDTPPLPGLDGNFYVPGTADYHVAMTEMMLAGFPVAHDPNNFFPPLPPEKVAIGVPANSLVRQFVSMGGLSDSLNYLIKGESYGGHYVLQNPAGYPNLLGMMTWSATLDRWANYQFSNTIGPLLHQLPTVVPGNCTYSLNPTSASIAGTGGSGSVAVIAGNGCNWIAQNWTAGADWLSITSDSSGTGNGTVKYQASANVGDARSATLTIGGVSFTVNQACELALNDAGASFGASGGTGTVTVSTGASCTWAVTSALNWITISSGASGTGNGTITYNVAANTGAARAGAIGFGGGVNYSVQQESGMVSGLSALGSMAQIASAGGWDTLLTLVNTGTASAEAIVNFSGNDGSALSLPFTFPQTSTGPLLGSTFDQTISANATLLLDTTGPSSQASLAGAAQLMAASGVNGFAIFTYAPTGQEAVVPLETRKAGSYLLAFDNTGAVATGVAIANLATSAASVNVVIRDDTGALLGTGAISLAAAGHNSFMLTDSKNGFPATAGKRGTVEFDTPQGGQISALGLRANGSALTTLPVLANVGTTGGTMAHIASGGGWQTTFTLVNTGAAAATVNLNFYGNDGSALSLPLSFPQSQTNSGASQGSGGWYYFEGSNVVSGGASSVSQSIAAGASLIVVVQDPGTGVTTTGSAVLTTSGNVSGFAVFQYQASAQTQVQEAVVPLESDNASSYVLAFDNTGTLSTGLAIANVATQAANVSLLIRDDAGAQIGTGTINLNANGHASFMLTDATQGYPVTAGKRGTVEFVTPQGGQISPLGLRASTTSPGSFAVTTIPVIEK